MNKISEYLWILDMIGLKCGKIVVLIIGISGPSTKMANFTTYKRISELCLMYKWLLYQLIDIRRGKICLEVDFYVNFDVLIGVSNLGMPKILKPILFICSYIHKSKTRHKSLELI